MMVSELADTDGAVDVPPSPFMYAITNPLDNVVVVAVADVALACVLYPVMGVALPRSELSQV